MKIRMLASAKGSSDGVRVERYLEGEVYDVTPALCDVFVAHGLAEEVEINIELESPEEDEPDADDEPKMGEGPAENKSE